MLKRTPPEALQEDQESSFRRLSSRPAAGSASRNIACGFASGCLPTASPFKAMDRRTALQSTFLKFLSAAADFALTLI